MSTGIQAQAILISVIIPCRNERKEICAFLDSLFQQAVRAGAWEVLLADGMSTDGTREILAEYQAREPRLVILDNPAGFVSHGLNTAILAAKGEVIVRMDCHTTYAPDYIERCVALLRSTGAQNVGGPARTKATGLMARAIAGAYHSPFSTGGARFHDEQFEGWVDTVTYGCWWKSDLLRWGLFDENLLRNQDDELNLRIIRDGGRIWQSPAVVSWYHPRGTLAQLFRQYFQYGFWKVAVIRKHRIPASPRHLVPGSFALGSIFLLFVGIGAWTLQAEYWRMPLVILASVWVLYLSLLLVASIDVCRRRGWDLLPVLPAVFWVYHWSYGLGFLLALVQSPAKKDGSTRVMGAVSDLTR